MYVLFTENIRVELNKISTISRVETSNSILAHCKEKTRSLADLRFLRLKVPTMFLKLKTN